MKQLAGLGDQPGGDGPSPNPRASFKKVFLEPFHFYHPGQENCMADNVSRLFHFSDTQFIAHMYFAYPQPYILWKISPLPQELLSCVISTLHRKPRKRAVPTMRYSRGCTSSGYTSSGLTSVPPCRLILISRIHPSLASKSSKSTSTGSVTPINPIAKWTNLGNNWFLRHGGRLQRPTS